MVPYSCPPSFKTKKRHHPKAGAAKLAEDVDHILSSDSVVATVCRGAAHAVWVHMTSNIVHVNGWIPRILDENAAPLCDEHSALTSFPLTLDLMSRPAGRYAIQEFVCALAVRLEMTASELATAISLLETLLIRHPGVLKPYTLRPLLYAAAVVAAKNAQDNELSSLECYHAVCDLFTRARPLQTSRIEAQFLVLIDWTLPLKTHVHDAYVSEMFDAGLRKGQPTLERAELLRNQTALCSCVCV